MGKVIIPIETISYKDYWYMDVSKLSLSELLKLRNELSGTIGYRALDDVFYNRSGIPLSDCYNSEKRNYRRMKEIKIMARKYKRKYYKH